ELSARCHRVASDESANRQTGESTMNNTLSKMVSFLGSDTPADAGLPRGACARKRTLTAGLRRMGHAMVRKFDVKVGISSDHLHFIVDVSLRAFLNFMMFMRMATRRQKLPVDA